MQRHAGEGETIAEAIRDCLDYGKNPEKTESGKYISAYECDPVTVADEFLLTKASYAAMTGREQKKANDVLCYQIRQSFYPGEITPREANRIGYELAMSWTKGRHAFIVTTHTDKQHIHCHIYYNSTTLDCTRKFQNFWGSSFALRRLSDRLCLENGLSIVENPKPRSKGKYRNYGEWQKERKGPLSYQDRLRLAIDLLGGIEVDIKEEEVQYMNEFLEETAQVAGKEAKFIEHSGNQLLDGSQAVTYARIRSTAGGDYTRTERQRLVLEKIFDKVLHTKLGTINKIIDEVFPQVSTSFSLKNLIGLAADVTQYQLGEAKGFPFELTDGNVDGVGSSVIPLGLAENVQELHEFLYPKDEYTVSEKVKEIASEIETLTGYTRADYTESAQDTENQE